MGNYGVHFLSELAQRLQSDEVQVYTLDFATLRLKEGQIEYDQYSKELASKNKIKFSDRLIRPLLINKILREHDFDKVNFQFLYWHYVFSVLTFKKISAKVFFTIFGSDFYRAGKFKKNYIYPRILKSIDGLIFTNEKTKQDFLYAYPFVASIKTDVCRLGLPALPFIDKNRNANNILHEYFDISPAKTVIAVGYNLTKEQQHIKAIDAINRLSEDERAGIYVLFPLTYGGTPEYLNEIKTYLKTNANFEYTIYTAYMDNDEIAKLRLVTDIMINILTTDQFSGSMQEHLYANNIVIAGEWLPYETMIDKGVNMQRIKNVEALPDALSYVLTQLPMLKEKTKNNPQYIVSLSSWDNVISCWKSIFHG